MKFKDILSNANFLGFNFKSSTNDVEGAFGVCNNKKSSGKQLNLYYHDNNLEFIFIDKCLKQITFNIEEVEQQIEIEGFIKNNNLNVVEKDKVPPFFICRQIEKNYPNGAEILLSFSFKSEKLLSLAIVFPSVAIKKELLIEIEQRFYEKLQKISSENRKSIKQIVEEMINDNLK